MRLSFIFALSDQESSSLPPVWRPDYRGTKNSASGEPGVAWVSSA